MKYCLIVWDHSGAYTLNKVFWSEKSAIDFAKSRASKYNHVQLYSCEKKQDIFCHKAM